MGATEQPPAAGEPGRHGLQELTEERRAKGQRLRETRPRRRERARTATERARGLDIDRASVGSAVRADVDGNGLVEGEAPVLQALYGGAVARPFTNHRVAQDREL